jgi:hypothetical protein
MRRPIWAEVWRVAIVGAGRGAPYADHWPTIVHGRHETKGMS